MSGPQVVELQPVNPLGQVMLSGAVELLSGMTGSVLFEGSTGTVEFSAGGSGLGSTSGYFPQTQQLSSGKLNAYPDH